MTDQQYADIVEHATTTIIGDRQEITNDEMRQVVWLVAEIMTDSRNSDEGTTS